MQYDNKYDLDHNDCPEYETDVPEEFASDFVVGTDDFTETPDEFGGNQYGSDEQVATTDLSGAYGDENSNSDEYDNDGCGSGDCYRIGGNEYNTESANDYSDNVGTDDVSDSDKPDPYAEQAATSDNWCNCGDSCGCDETAQEKCKLDDYEIISDVLGSEKQLVKLYSTALCEAAEENFRDIIRENFTEAAADQYKAFTYMQENGMYPTEQAPENKILEAKQQFPPLCRNCTID